MTGFHAGYGRPALAGFADRVTCSPLIARSKGASILNKFHLVALNERVGSGAPHNSSQPRAAEGGTPPRAECGWTLLL